MVVGGIYPLGMLGLLVEGEVDVFLRRQEHGGSVIRFGPSLRNLYIIQARASRSDLPALATSRDTFTDLNTTFQNIKNPRQPVSRILDRSSVPAEGDPPDADR